MNAEKLLAMLALIPLIILAQSLIGACFVYYGWNGCRELLGVREIFFREAFWLCMLCRSLLTVTTASTEKS